MYFIVHYECVYFPNCGEYKCPRDTACELYVLYSIFFKESKKKKLSIMSKYPFLIIISMGVIVALNGLKWEKSELAKQIMCNMCIFMMALVCVGATGQFPMSRVCVHQFNFIRPWTIWEIVEKSGFFYLFVFLTTFFQIYIFALKYTAIGKNTANYFVVQV